VKVKVHRVGHGRSFSVVIPKPIIRLLASYYDVDPEDIEYLNIDYSNGTIYLTLQKRSAKNFAMRISEAKNYAIEIAEAISKPFFSEEEEEVTIPYNPT